MKPNRSAWLLLGPALLALALLLVAPLLNIALESVRQYTPGHAGSLPGAPLTTQNYLEFLYPAYLLYFYDTFRISLVATVFGIAVGFPIAYAVARHRSGSVRRLWIGFLIAMMFLSVLVRAYSIQLTLGPVGLLRIIASSTGINTNTTFFAELLIIAGLMHYVIPIAALTLIGPVQNINPRLAEAAQALGASRVVTHRTITLPLALHGILSAFLICYTLCISAFVIPMILGKGQIFFVSNLIYSRFQETANYPSGSALAVIMLVLSLAVIFGITRLAQARWNPAMIGKRRVDRAATGVVHIIIALAVLFLLLPVVVGIVMSFDARSFLGPFPPKALSLRWYDRFFADPVFMRALKVSFVLAVVATAISTIIGVAAAVALDRYRFRGREALIAFFLSPLIVPAVVIGFAMLLFYSRLGIYDGFTRLIGAHVIIALPYTLRATLAGLVEIRASLTEAALSLGATPRQAFFDVTLPLARTGIIAGAVLAFAFSFDEVAVSLFLVDPQSNTLPVALVSMMRANFDLTVAAASTMLVGVTVLLILILDRLIGIDRVVGQGVYQV